VKPSISSPSAAAPLPSGRWQEFSAGLRGVLPLIIGIIPFGMIYGVLAISAGLSVGLSQATSAIIFAGASQFAMVQLLGAGAQAWVVILTVVVLNLRHVLYSASIAPHFQHLPARWKAILAYFLTDEAYAVSILKYNRDGDTPTRHWYFLGAGLTLWSFWQLSTAAGIFLGAVIPPSWPLDFAVALTFIAMVVPSIRQRSEAAAALSAGITAVVLHGLPYNLGLILAALVGIGVGLWADRSKAQ
jgi:4-azaleucine resistance transporter AzlC